MSLTLWQLSTVNHFSLGKNYYYFFCSAHKERESVRESSSFLPPHTLKFCTTLSLFLKMSASLDLPPAVEEITSEIELVLLLVSGKRKAFNFSKDTTVAQVKRHVLDNWPKGMCLPSLCPYFCYPRMGRNSAYYH